jgi:hypothetical protein
VTLNRAVLVSSFVLLASCQSNQPPPVHSLGDAYVGPSTLTLRQDLATKSPISATVKHGDKLAVVEYRHRLVKVRTAQGVEGWTDMRQLLTPEQMDQLRGMAEGAANFPSQGSATVFESLNLHTEPSRTSPSFAQIPENSKADVIAHKLTPRVQHADSPMPTPVKPAPSRKKTKPNASPAKVAPPPRLPAPKPPGNWVALSVPKAPVETPAASTSSEPPAPIPMDDWSLVRTHDGKVGWVLTRPLNMAIPDEVAQYAEGHRITSYFALGQVHDDGAVKNNWLWTTITKGGQPYEFDSFRVFVWSLKHHRYETAYIERNVVGHYPVRVNASDSSPSFSVVVEGVDGQRYRKTYSFEGFRVRMVSRALDSQTPAADAPKLVAGAALPQPQPEVKRSLYARLREQIHRLLR